MNTMITPFGVASTTTRGIHFLVNKSHISGMDTSEIRRLRLRSLVGDQFPTARALAAAIDRKEQQVNDMLAGRKSFGERIARDIEEKLGLVRGWLDSSVDQLHPSIPPQQEAQPASEEVYAMIPQFSTRGSCGSGYYNDHVEVAGGMAFKKDWLARKGLDEHSACVIYADGDSMMPTIGDGDVLLLDRRETTPANGQVYALLVDEEVLVKRVQRGFGMMTLLSDNPDKTRFRDIMVPANAELIVIGKVVWRGGGL